MSGGISLPAPSSAGRARSKRRSSSRRLRNKAFALQLTSLMDALMIIVVFLLKSYGISSMNIAQDAQLQLPVSRAPEAFGEGLTLMVARDRIVVDGQPVVQFTGNPEERTFQLPEGTVENGGNERGILPLFEALQKKKADFELLASRSPDPTSALKQWKGEIMVQADKGVPYEILRRVMFTAGRAGYQKFRLTVEKQSD